jgi:hypothetical protein
MLGSRAAVAQSLRSPASGTVLPYSSGRRKGSLGALTRRRQCVAHALHMEQQAQSQGTLEELEDSLDAGL